MGPPNADRGVPPRVPHCRVARSVRIITEAVERAASRVTWPGTLMGFRAVPDVLQGWQALRLVRGLLPTLRIGSGRGQVLRFSTPCPRAYPVHEGGLSLRGRYGKVTDTLGVKETQITTGAG